MTSRINADTRGVVILTTTLVGLIGVVSFMVSFAGLIVVAEWAQLPPALRWAMPAFIDGALLAFTLAILVQRARGESTIFSWCALGFFTAFSVGANGAHVLGSADPTDWRILVGAAAAMVAPLGIFAATHTVATLAIAPPEEVVEEDDGLSYRKIAAKIGVSPATVGRMVAKARADDN